MFEKRKRETETYYITKIQKKQQISSWKEKICKFVTTDNETVNTARHDKSNGLFLFDEKKASYEKIIDRNDLISPKQNICLGPPYPISYIQ